MGSLPIIGRIRIRREQKSLTFTGAAGLGAIGTFALFTVTGEVLIVALVPFCTVDVGVDAGTFVASMQLGVTGATNLLIATTPAADIDANEFWVDSTPDANGVAVPAGLKDIAITADITGEVTSTGTQKVNAGTIRFDLYWLPLSSDGLVVPA